MVDNTDTTILTNSRAIAFRRKAAETLEEMNFVYLSSNINIFGYDAHEFLNGTRNIKEIIHPADYGRVIKEIKEYTEYGITEYRQVYRIITQNKEVRWVEDHTIVIKENNTGALYHQGILTDITESRMSLHKACMVQCQLFPFESPNVVGLDISSKTIPFDLVGGDFYDYFWDEKDPHAPISVVVGDVSGHELDSAIIGARALGYLRMGALVGLPLDKTVTMMNQDLTCLLNGTGHFLTLMYFRISEDRTSLEWVRAGHDALLLYSPGTDSFTPILGKGLPIGANKEQHFTLNKMSGLQTGQILVSGTDGICESQNKQGEMFGKLRVQSIIKENANGSAQDIRDAIFSAHSIFTHGIKRSDDLTLVVIKIT